MNETRQQPKRCPVCGKPAVGEFQPFCSLRCSTLDLGKWLGDVYKVETGENDEYGEEGASLTDPGEAKERD